MGAYNEYEHVQLKIGDCGYFSFHVGDEVPLENGIYIGYEGAIVVQDGIFKAVFANNQIRDKWGNNINTNNILYDENPVGKAIKYFKEKKS